LFVFPVCVCVEEVVVIGAIGHRNIGLDATYTHSLPLIL
jgi:hypothetical protein